MLRHELCEHVAILPESAGMVFGGGFPRSAKADVRRAAQRAITDMRRRVEAHVARLPVRYFDSTQSGVLVSRVMNDAEGIRNLVGTGLVQNSVTATACDRVCHQAHAPKSGVGGRVPPAR